MTEMFAFCCLMIGTLGIILLTMFSSGPSFQVFVDDDTFSLHLKQPTPIKFEDSQGSQSWQVEVIYYEYPQESGFNLFINVPESIGVDTPYIIQFYSKEKLINYRETKSRSSISVVFQKEDFEEICHSKSLGINIRESETAEVITLPRSKVAKFQKFLPQFYHKAYWKGPRFNQKNLITQL